MFRSCGFQTTWVDVIARSNAIKKFDLNVSRPVLTDVRSRGDHDSFGYNGCQLFQLPQFIIFGTKRFSLKGHSRYELIHFEKPVTIVR